MDHAQKKEISASTFIVIAGCCWGMLGLFSRPLSDANLDSVQISMLRSLVSSVSLLFISLVSDRNKLHICVKDIWLFIGTGILSIAFFNICYFISIRENTLSLAAILLYTAPSFVIIISKFIFKERITKQKLLALVLSFVGSFFAAGAFSVKFQTSAFGLAVGLCAGIGYALYSIFSRVALEKYNWFTVITYTFLFAAAALFPFSKPMEVFKVIEHTPAVAASILALGWFSTLLPFLLYTKGLKHLEAGKAALLTFVEPVVATLVGIAAFHEKVTVYNIGGISFIILSLVILNADKLPFTSVNRYLRWFTVKRK